MVNDDGPAAPPAADSVLPPHRMLTDLSALAIRRAVGLDPDWVPAWLRPTGPENRLPVAASIVVVIALLMAWR